MSRADRTILSLVVLPVDSITNQLQIFPNSYTILIWKNNVQIMWTNTIISLSYLLFLCWLWILVLYKAYPKGMLYITRIQSSRFSVKRASLLFIGYESPDLWIFFWQIRHLMNCSFQKSISELFFLGPEKKFHENNLYS